MYCNDDSAVAMRIQKPEAGKSGRCCDAVVLCGIFCVFNTLNMRDLEFTELTPKGALIRERGLTLLVNPLFAPEKDCYGTGTGMAPDGSADTVNENLAV